MIRAAEVLPDHGNGHGKGAALWRSLYESEGDLVVWCDADLVDSESHFVLGLLGPLLTHPDVDFVKGFYDRPSSDPGDRGGRVTELVARPALSLLFPLSYGPGWLDKALDRLCRAAAAAIDDGHNVLILSDRGVSAQQIAIPSLLALSAVQQHLVLAVHTTCTTRHANSATSAFKRGSSSSA